MRKDKNLLRNKQLPVRFSDKELNELKFLQALNKYTTLAAFVRDRLGIRYSNHNYEYK